jgi:type II secretory pathway pseudopilin PulG
VSNLEPTRDPFLELIEAYALGALDREERASLETHLAAGCPACGKALEESRWLAAQLAYLAPEARPSDILRGRLLKAVVSDIARDRIAPAPAGAAIPLWMWGAVAAVALFALYNFYQAQSLRRAIRQTEAALNEQIEIQRRSARELALTRREAIILTDPRSVKISMSARQKELPSLQASWHAALGIVVSGQNLPVPSGNRTLQLWLIPKIAGARAIPSLTVRPDADGKFHMLVQDPPGSQGDTKALAITEEPEGGSLQPTTTPIWVGTVAGK